MPWKEPHEENQPRTAKQDESLTFILKMLGAWRSHPRASALTLGAILGMGAPAITPKTWWSMLSGEQPLVIAAKDLPAAIRGDTPQDTVENVTQVGLRFVTMAGTVEGSVQLVEAMLNDGKTINTRARLSDRGAVAKLTVESL